MKIEKALNRVQRLKDNYNESLILIRDILVELEERFSFDFDFDGCVSTFFAAKTSMWDGGNWHTWKGKVAFAVKDGNIVTVDAYHNTILTAKDFAEYDYVDINGALSSLNVFFEECSKIDDLGDKKDVLRSILKTLKGGAE